MTDDVQKVTRFVMVGNDEELSTKLQVDQKRGVL